MASRMGAKNLWMFVGRNRKALLDGLTQAVLATGRNITGHQLVNRAMLHDCLGNIHQRLMAEDKVRWFVGSDRLLLAPAPNLTQNRQRRACQLMAAFDTPYQIRF